MKSILFFFAPILLVCFSLQSQILHVPQTYGTIQEGINAAVDHDTVMVATGEYFENINFNGKNIVVCSNFAITGDPNYITTTIINGSLPTYADTASCVLIVSGEDSTAVLQGFTLTGGTGTRWEDEHNTYHWYTEGGGILIQYSSPTIRDNIISGNEAINKPVGVTSAGGGGIRCGDGNPHILNNVISYNQGRYGGGIVMNYSGAVIKNNIIFGNSGGSDFGGGGLWLLSNGDMPLILENNTIVNNASSMGGGGIRQMSNFTTITNNIIWGNTANYSPQIQGGGNINYCCIEGGNYGEGNIEVDPEFTPISFILSDNSPCIDAGSSDEIFNDPEDPNNTGYALYPAQGGLHSDIGAYGGPGCIQLPDIVTSVDQTPIDTQSIICNIFPNPATSTISIDLVTNHKDAVEIQIFDSKAVFVKQVASNLVINSRMNIETDVADLSSGVYFLRITSKNGVQVRKFIKN